MTPSVDDRINSILRALNSIIVPALPADASLAQDQSQLIIAQLSILQKQLKQQHAFEKQEAQDFAAMATAIIDIVRQEPALDNELDNLKQIINNTASNKPSHNTDNLQQGIDQLLQTIQKQADTETLQQVNKVILKLGSQRAKKDRQWFAPMGFDRDFH